MAREVMDATIVMRYSEALKRKVVEEVKKGELTPREAAARYGIANRRSVDRWVRQYGKGSSETKIVRVMMKSEQDRIKAEFLLDSRFLTMSQLQRAVDQAVFSYNHLRVHGSLNGRTPAEAHFGSDSALELWAHEVFCFQMPPYPALQPVNAI